MVTTKSTKVFFFKYSHTEHLTCHLFLICFSKQQFFFKMPQLCGFLIRTTLEPKTKTLIEILQDSPGQIPQTCSFTKPSENAYDLSKFLATILCSQVLMSATESIGSHQLHSFAA